jgi:hypothetical protein
MVISGKVDTVRPPCDGWHAKDHSPIGIQPVRFETDEMWGVTVSVFVIARFTVADLGKALEWGKVNGDVVEDITAYGKSLGQIGHRMLTDGKDMVVIDEWPDADTFNKFFAGAARMGEFLSGAGVVGEPEVTMLDTVDVGGQF